MFSVCCTTCVLLRRLYQDLNVSPPIYVWGHTERYRETERLGVNILTKLLVYRIEL